MTEAFVAKRTEKSETPVPEDLRKELGLSPLQEVRLLKRSDDLVVRAVTAEALCVVSGSVGESARRVSYTLGTGTLLFWGKDSQ